MLDFLALFNFTPIEWIFTILTFVSFYFLIDKYASDPQRRIYGFAIGIIASVLQIIFLLSKGIISMPLISVFFILMRIKGIKNCSNELKDKKEDY